MALGHKEILLSSDVTDAGESGHDTSSFRWILSAILLLIIFLPFVVYPVFLMKLMCFALFAAAFNLALGYCGLLSFGHAAFFGAGAYMAAYASAKWALPPEVAVALGTMLALVLGLAFGALAIRRHGIYLAMVTLGLAELVYFFALHSRYTGAEDGIQGVSRGVLFGMFDLRDMMTIYVVVATVFFLALLFIYRLIFSPFGQIFRAVRANEQRAISLGLDAQRIKLMMFVISAGLSGLAGAMKAIIFQIASLVDLHISTSGDVVLMTLIGGVGTFLGPLVGASIVVVSQNYLAWLGEWVVFIQGLIFVISVLVFREGIVGVISRKLGRPL